MSFPFEEKTSTAEAENRARQEAATENVANLAAHYPVLVGRFSESDRGSSIPLKQMLRRLGVTESKNIQVGHGTLTEITKNSIGEGLIYYFYQTQTPGQGEIATLLRCWNNISQPEQPVCTGTVSDTDRGFGYAIDLNRRDIMVLPAAVAEVSRALRSWRTK